MSEHAAAPETVQPGVAPTSPTDVAQPADYGTPAPQSSPAPSRMDQLQGQLRAAEDEMRMSLNDRFGRGGREASMKAANIRQEINDLKAAEAAAAEAGQKTGDLDAVVNDEAGVMDVAATTNKRLGFEAFEPQDFDHLSIAVKSAKAIATDFTPEDYAVEDAHITEALFGGDGAKHDAALQEIAAFVDKTIPKDSARQVKENLDKSGILNTRLGLQAALEFISKAKVERK